MDSIHRNKLLRTSTATWAGTRKQVPPRLASTRKNRQSGNPDRSQVMLSSGGSRALVPLASGRGGRCAGGAQLPPLLLPPPPRSVVGRSSNGGSGGGGGALLISTPFTCGDANGTLANGRGVTTSLPNERGLGRLRPAQNRAIRWKNACNHVDSRLTLVGVASPRVRGGYPRRRRRRPHAPTADRPQARFQTKGACS